MMLHNKTQMIVDLTLFRISPVSLENEPAAMPKKI